MEVKIGIVHAAREIVIDTTASAKHVEDAFAAAVAEDSLLTLTDERGRKVLIPAARVAYLELGQEHSRPVGFGLS